MEKNELLKILCGRLGSLKVIDKIDYSRIEELSFLILKILRDETDDDNENYTIFIKKALSAGFTDEQADFLNEIVY